MSYNPWPLGKLPKGFERPELEQLKAAGYELKDARDAVTLFEEKIANFAGCRYAISTDCCTHALFLCLKYFQMVLDFSNDMTITIPSRTYLSLPMLIKQAGYKVRFVDYQWEGIYKLKPLPVYDSATRFTKDMARFINGFQCLSFQIKKRLPIGRGGMILTNDDKAAKWLKLASYDGRDLTKPYDKDRPPFLGWHFYMTPEDAARGILLFDKLTEKGQSFDDTATHRNYTDLRTYEVLTLCDAL